MGRIKGQHIKATVSWQNKGHPWKSFRGKKPRGGKLAGGRKRKCKCSLNGPSCPRLLSKDTYQPHHPNRVLYPDWTICVRQNHHLFIRRQVQQLSVNNDTLMDLVNLKRAVQYEIDRRQEILSSLMVGNQSNEQFK